MKTHHFIALGIGVALILAFIVVWGRRESPAELEPEIYELIKERYLLPSGMVASTPEGTTSESESYGMLLALLNNKPDTFESIWSWTKHNLQVRDDGLFSWIWFRGAIQDTHSATDADEDIAFALILASQKWGNDDYLRQAQKILNDLWEKDTGTAGGVRYIAGGDWSRADPTGLVLNPSYLAPYAYRTFAKVDSAHDWMNIVHSSYDALNKCSRPRGIAPNWCKLDSEGRVIQDFTFPNKDSQNFSYDALRVPFRIAVDYHLYGDPRARAYLEENTVFRDEWRHHQKIYAAYTKDGEHVGGDESLASYGAELAAFTIVDRGLADEIFQKKISRLHPSWRQNSFYDLSWLWFGIHFYTYDINLGTFSFR